MRVGIIIRTLDHYYAHVKPFIESCKERDVSFYLFHNNKYYGGNAKIDTNKICVIDLSYKLNPAKILKQTNIDALVFFNPGNIYDQNLLFICRKLGILSVYFQHGLRIINAGNATNIKLRVNSWFKAALKYFYFYLNVFYSLFIIDKKVEFLSAILESTSVLIKGDNYYYKNIGLPVNKCDIAFVFSKKDKQALVKLLRYEDEKIIVSGYPLALDEIENDFKSVNYYLYISSGLREAGVINISDEQEKEFLLKIYEGIKLTGEKLVIKLHPREDVKKYEHYFNGLPNVIIEKDINLQSVVKNSKVVIGDYSTALFYAVLFKKPIIILPNPFMEYLPYDFTEFGIGKKIMINNFCARIINYDMAINSLAYQSFIEEMRLDNIASVYDKFYNVLEDYLSQNKKKLR